MPDDVALEQIDYAARCAIGEEARHFRGSRTQEDIEAKAGIAQAVLSRVENGHQDLRLGFIIRLSLALGCKPSDLLAPIDDVVAAGAGSKVAQPA